MPYISCVVASCSTQRNNRTRKSDVIKCFSFPKDPVLRQKWLNLCQVPNLDPAKDVNRRVCIKHFKECDFVDGLKGRLMNFQPTRLKKDAMPSLHLNNEPVAYKRNEIDIQKGVDILFTQKLKNDHNKHTEINKSSSDQKNGSDDYLSKLIPIAPKSRIAPKKQPTPKHVKQDKKQDETFIENQAALTKPVLKPVVEHMSEHHIKVLIHDNTIYKKRIKDLIHDNTALKRRVKELEAEVQNNKQDFTTKVKQEFCNLFSPNQIDVMLHIKKKPLWTEEEYMKAYNLQSLSDKAFVYIKEVLNYPLPSLFSIRTWVKGLGNEISKQEMDPIVKALQQTMHTEDHIEFEVKNDIIEDIATENNINVEDTTKIEDIVIKKEDTDLCEVEIDEMDILDVDNKLEPNKYEYLIDYTENGGDHITQDYSIHFHNQSSESNSDENKSDEVYFKSELDEQLGDECSEELTVGNFIDNKIDMVYCGDNETITIDEDNG